MEPFVLDASIAFSWCFPDDPSENTPYSRATLKLLEQADAVVPEIWPFEIGNSIFISYSKRKRITVEQIAEYVTLLKSLPIRVERRDLMANIDLESTARKHSVTVYDASYLDLALRHGWQLATADGPLSRAALGVGLQLFSP
jgi:predicted nucleic acid-binding protein